MHTTPLHHLLQIAKCWSRSLLHPQGQPSAGIRGVLRADRFRSEFRSDPAPTPSIRRSLISRTSGSRTPWAEETSDSEDKIAPSPNMRRGLSRLQNKASSGTSSLVGGFDNHWKEKTTPKKTRPSLLRKKLKVVKKNKDRKIGLRNFLLKNKSLPRNFVSGKSTFGSKKSGETKAIRVFHGNCLGHHLQVRDFGPLLKAE